MNGDREKILARIREALRTPAERPGAHGGASLNQAADASGASAPDYTDWLPLVGEDFAAQVALFAELSAALKSEFFLLQNVAELPGCIAQLATESGWQRVATHRAPLTQIALQDFTNPILHVDGGYQVEEMKSCDASLTECEALVAQTGSVLVSSLRSGGRALSVLPPHHVVVARASQMVGDLTEAYALLRRIYGANYPSFLSFVTGPSRTGDIERILVLGAHGPKRLTIFCVPDDENTASASAAASPRRLS